MNDHDQIIELMPLHALDALEGDDLDSVVAHLETCETCPAELARHQSVVAGFVADEVAPAHVWDRIAAEIGEPDSSHDIVDLEQRRPARDRRLTWLASVAAAAAIVLGGVAIYQAATINELSGQNGVVTAAEAAAEEPGAIVAEFTTDAGPVASVVLTADGEGFLLPSDLESLGDDRTYQLWVITPDELVISAGVLGSEPAPARFTWTGDVAGFALTREVAGGVVSSAGDIVSAVEV